VGGRLVWWAVVVAWVSLLPSWGWPGLDLQVSSRLGYLFGGLILTVAQLRVPASVVLSRRVLLLVAWGAALCAWHLREPLRSGDYFAYFLETSAVSNGVSVLAVSTLAFWALLQVPAGRWRQVPWVVVPWLFLNVIVVLAERWTGVVHPAGIAGTNRILASLAVAWMPICLAWMPWTSAFPVALLCLSHRPLAILAAAVSLWPFLAWRWRVASVALSLPVAWWAHEGVLDLQFSQRWETWTHAAVASAAHPIAGWGFSPMVLNEVRQEYGYLLPSLHSDWLTLALCGGWVTAILALAAWGRVLRSVPATRWGMACQGSLLGLGVLSAVQETVSQARVGAVALLLMAWWSVEQRGERNHA
jgi:hypothetical protein